MRLSCLATELESEKPFRILQKLEFRFIPDLQRLFNSSRIENTSAISLGQRESGRLRDYNLTLY